MNCQCALHVVACCVLWPAGPQRQESPFNLNTYHHDNNLVTLSEANLFISRFFFSLPLLLSLSLSLPPAVAVIHSLYYPVYPESLTVSSLCPVSV